MQIRQYDDPDYIFFFIQRNKHTSWRKFIQPLVDQFGNIVVNNAQTDFEPRDGFPEAVLIKIPFKPEMTLIEQDEITKKCTNYYNYNRNYHFFAEAAINAPLTINLYDFGIPDITIPQNLTGDALKKAILTAFATGLAHCDSVVMLNAFATKFMDSPAFDILKQSQGFFTTLCKWINTNSVHAAEQLIRSREQEIVRTLGYQS